MRTLLIDPSMSTHSLSFLETTTGFIRTSRERPEEKKVMRNKCDEERGHG
jgi:hypothetical protein